jgi:hypothetical protein
MYRLRFTFLFLFIVMMIAQMAGLAQFNTSLQIQSTYDDNSFAFYDQRADVYHQFFLSVSKDFSTDYSFVQPYYYGALVLFRTYDQRTYNQHTLGALWTIQLSHRDSGDGDDEEIDADDEADGGEDTASVDEETDGGEDSTGVDEEDDGSGGPDANPEEGIERKHEREKMKVIPLVQLPQPETAFSDSMVTYLHIKPALSGRFDHDAYNFYDYRSASLSGMLRWNPFGSLISRIQYGAEFKDHPYMIQFTHVEQLLGLTLSMRVMKHTECFVTGEFGYKVYTRDVADTTYETTVNQGKGKGSVKKKIKSIEINSTPSTDQLAAGLGIVQTLGASSTASLSYVKRVNPSNNARWLDKRGDIQAYEADVFDDRYGYQSHELAGHIETLMLFGLPLTVHAEYQWKYYPRVATDIDGYANSGNKKRADKRLEFSAQLSVPVMKKSDGSALMSVGCSYSFIRNQSNDAYHDYYTNQISAVLEFGI